MEIAYKISIGYADIDEFDDYSSICNGYVFAIAEEINDDYQCYVKCLTEGNEFEKIVDEGEVPEAIAEFLSNIDAFGRNKDLMQGTIQCAMDGDEDGLSDLIEEDGLSIEIIEGIPDEIDGEHDGRIFAIGEKYNISIDSIGEVNLDLILSNNSGE